MTRDFDRPPAQPPPVPVAMRAMPLEYVQASYARRPGIVTAIGVMSIVVGSLSVLTNFYFGLMSAGFMFVAGAAGPMAPRFTATGTVTVSGTTATSESSDTTGAMRGWPAPARDAAVGGLSELRPIPPARRALLDALLAECGQDVFPFDASQVTAAQVKSNVSEHGVLPAGTANAGADYFVTGNGRIDVSEREAAFVPADRRADPVRVTPAGVGGAAPTTAAAAATLPAFGNPFAGMSRWPFVVMLLEAIASFGLAIYLIVIGILVLRHSPKGARLHWAYVWIKILLASAGAFAYAWMMMEMMRSVRQTIGAGAGGVAFPLPTFVFLFYVVFLWLISCAYPIGLIFTLRGRGVRAYYGSISEGKTAGV